MSSIRDAIADSFQERWPHIKVTDHVEDFYGGNKPTGSASGRINIELPSSDNPDIALRVASVQLIEEKIEATFYGGSSYAHNIYHPESITDLEDLLAAHIAEVEGIAKDVSL